MSLKCNKRLFIRTVLRNVSVALLLVALCVFSILLYYFVQPRPYRASLTFSLSDSVGTPLPIDKQNDLLAFLFSQLISLNDPTLQNFSSDSFQKKNIRLSRNADLIDLTFEAGTVEAAQYGLETWFAAFLQEIIKQKKRSLLTKLQASEQYDKAAILNILQEFRSSIDSFVSDDVKRTEFNDLSVQLTEATLKRIHLTSLNSTINVMRKNGQSLLSLSFIASNSMIAALEAKRDLLETQRAHMVAQLGWTHPQIKAMTAELEAISHQLENKISQIVHQVHLDEVIATEFEKLLRKKIALFTKDQSQSLNQIFGEFENKIIAVVGMQSQAMSKDSSILQNAKIRVVVPTTLVPVSFMALYGKGIIISVFASLITLLGGVFLFYKFSGTKKGQPEENVLKNDESALVSKKIKNLESFITIEGLSDFLKCRTATVVSIIGSEAARTAAKLSLHLIKEHKTILLVDISGQQIEKLIGPHRGLSDILTGNVQLHDVIYRDYDTGVDILPQGLTSTVCAQDFSNNIPNILQEFKKEYDFVILEMAKKPEYGFEQFAELTDYYICSVSLNEQDWMMQMVSRFPKSVYRMIVS
ncbi:hypothetical protein [Bartonella sp. CB169]|uniref:hypothetical protein n=1 Tax=Bartonella sp. CB169 TaxID=3112257 RepID=UPI00300E620D